MAATERPEQRTRVQLSTEQALVKSAAGGDLDALQRLLRFTALGLVNDDRNSFQQPPREDGFRLFDRATSVSVRAVCGLAARHVAGEAPTTLKELRELEQAGQLHTCPEMLAWSTLHVLDEKHEPRRRKTQREEVAEWKLQWHDALSAVRDHYRVLVDSMTRRLHFGEDRGSLRGLMDIRPPAAQRRALVALCRALRLMTDAAPTAPQRKGPEEDIARVLAMGELATLDLSDDDLASLILASNADWQQPPCPKFVSQYTDKLREGPGGGRARLLDWLRDRRRTLKTKVRRKRVRH